MILSNENVRIRFQRLERVWHEVLEVGPRRELAKDFFPNLVFLPVPSSFHFGLGGIVPINFIRVFFWSTTIISSKCSSSLV